MGASSVSLSSGNSSSNLIFDGRTDDADSGEEDGGCVAATQALCGDNNTFCKDGCVLNQDESYRRLQDGNEARAVTAAGWKSGSELSELDAAWDVAHVAVRALKEGERNMAEFVRQAPKGKVVCDVSDLTVAENVNPTNAHVGVNDAWVALQSRDMKKTLRGIERHRALCKSSSDKANAMLRVLQQEYAR